MVSGSLGFDQLTNNYFTENLIRRELISGKVILQPGNSRTSPFYKRYFTKSKFRRQINSSHCH